MKVFVADSKKTGYVSKNNYHWCKNNELLMFSLFSNSTDISMCGLESRKATTHILVKDINIDKKSYEELVTKCVEDSMNRKIDKKDIDNLVNELLEKASHFEDGQSVKCIGRKVMPYQKK